MAFSAAQWQELLSVKPLAIDGGMATALEERGHDLSSSLWSASLLADSPQEIAAVHRGYLEAGAEIVTTASYQVSRSGFERAGRTPSAADEALKNSVNVARSAGAKLVAASIGPYGATLADGSEYRGDYTISREELKRFHAERLLVLADAGADLFAFETVPAVLELQVINELLATEFSNLPAWISASACDGHRISDGTAIAQAFAEVSAPNVIAIGVNCTKPEHLNSLLEDLQTDSRAKVVYPNSGRTWDAVARGWSDEGTDLIPSQTVLEWVERGARLIGGCCGLTAKHISNVHATLASL